MSTSVNIFRNSGSSSSSGGGGGGQTIVSAVGKSVYFKSIDFQNWTIANANLSYDNWMVYDFSIVDNLVIAVTTDGNEPQVDLSNVLFGTEDINSEFGIVGIVFKIEVNGVVYKAVLNIFNEDPIS
jgi:hypothetical protein